MEIINPNDIAKSTMPLIAFVDDRRSWLGWRIKSHTSGNYNHVIILHRPGYFASQNPGGYKEVAIKEYYTEQYFLKFFAIKATDEEKEKMVEIINRKLKEKKKFGSYDYLGIIGQRLNISWLQNPWKEFCSENIISILNEALGTKIPAHNNPVKLHNELVKNPDRFSIYGYTIAG